MEFKKWNCKNGVAEPVNPYKPKYSKPNITDYERFLIFAKENTVSCSEDLSGEYSVDLFKEPVWQYYAPNQLNPEWTNVHDNLEWRMEFAKNNGCHIRQYIELKPLEKEPKITNVNDCPDWANDKCSCGYLKDCKLNNPVKQPEVKQDFGEFKVVEQLVDSEFFDVMQDVAKHQRYIEYPLENLLANGYDSQNVGKALRELGVDDKACLWFHKLIFACEGLVKNANFKKLEEKRVEFVCAKYRDKKTSPPKSI